MMKISCTKILSFEFKKLNRSDYSNTLAGLMRAPLCLSCCRLVGMIDPTGEYNVRKILKWNNELP